MKNLNMGIISNIIFEPHLVLLMKLHFGEYINLYPIPYTEQNENNYRKQLSKSDMIIVWLNFESLFANDLNTFYSYAATEQQLINKIIMLCQKLYADLSAYSKSQILWFSFEDFFSRFPLTIGHNYNILVDKLNMQLYDILSENISFINLKHLIARTGINNAYDFKGKYRWNSPYSKSLIETVIKEVYKQYLIEKGITKKCIVLDCDNVLWGGILSEDGMENIKLSSSGFGRSYQDFQRFVLSLHYHGVILAVCSKNDLFDVMTMFHHHNEMILKEEHIACFQANWDNKPDNIRKIADILNIGLDSMVFIDDSLIEVEAVKSMLPEVTAILYERDSIYEHLSCFNLKRNVKMSDIEKRNETYRTNQFREALKSQYDNYNEYITALEIKIDIHEALPIEFSRISELTQRTNKCTNGKRYSVADIKERSKGSAVTIYSLSVSDRFSDLGIVGALEIEKNILTLFNLSCRALSRGIEEKILKFIKCNHKIEKIFFRSTSKNENIKAILAKEFPNAVFLKY